MISFRCRAPIVGILAAAIFAAATLRWSAPSNAASVQGPIPAGKGRIFVFRMVRSYGAHLDNSVTVNGIPVKRVSPGSGLYCDVTPGSYTIGLDHQRAHPLEVSVVAGQQQYVCVMLNRKTAGSPRSGALSSDQLFDLRLLQPNFGAQRINEYRLVPANCQP